MVEEDSTVKKVGVLGRLQNWNYIYVTNYLECSIWKKKVNLNLHSWDLSVGDWSELAKDMSSQILLQLAWKFSNQLIYQSMLSSVRENSGNSKKYFSAS